MKFLKYSLFALFFVIAGTGITFSQTTTAASETNDNTTIATIKVKGVGCATDLQMICTNVEKLKGVSSFKSTKQGAVTTFEAKYDPALITEKEIHAAIENTGDCTNPEARPYKVKL